MTSDSIDAAKLNFRFLDFETDKAGHIFLVGVATTDGPINISFLDQRFASLCEATEFELVTPEFFLDECIDWCARESNALVGFSEHEFHMLNAMAEEFGRKIPASCTYVNGARVIKHWVNRSPVLKAKLNELPPLGVNKDEFVKPKKWSLASVSRLADYHCRSYGYGVTARRFATGAKALENKSYKELTRHRKAEITKAIRHNEDDVEALRVTFLKAIAESPKSLNARNAVYGFSSAADD